MELSWKLKIQVQEIMIKTQYTGRHLAAEIDVQQSKPHNTASVDAAPGLSRALAPAHYARV